MIGAPHYSLHEAPVIVSAKLCRFSESKLIYSIHFRSLTYAWPLHLHSELMKDIPEGNKSVFRIRNY